MDILDCTSLKCPLPLLKLKVALANMTSGDIIILRTNDPISCRDIPIFCANSSNELLNQSNTTPFQFEIKKGN